MMEENLRDPETLTDIEIEAIRAERTKNWKEENKYPPGDVFAIKIWRDKLTLEYRKEMDKKEWNSRASKVGLPEIYETVSSKKEFNNWKNEIKKRESAA